MPGRNVPRPVGMSRKLVPGEDLHVVMDLLGGLVEIALGIAGAPARVEGPGEVRVVAVAPDHVGVEGDQLVLADRVVRRP